MKTTFFPLSVIGGVLAAAIFAALPNSQGQAPATEDPALAAALVEIAAQQAVIAQNQTTIDEKVALIAEEVRQARLFVARGGGAK